jgi:Ras-related protein Rab-8A
MPLESVFTVEWVSVVGRQVIDRARGQALADEYEIPFFECSAKNDINVQEAFACLVEAVCNRMFNQQADGKWQGREQEGQVRLARKDSVSLKKKCCN